MNLHFFRTLAALLCVAAVTLASTVSALELPSERAARQQVDAVFTAARLALQKGDGMTLLGLLTRTSRSRLEAIRSTARSGSVAPLDRFSPSEKLAVLSLRRFVPAAELRRLKTAELIEYALERHWLRPETVAEAGLGVITLEGDRAGAPLIVKGKPGLLRAEFLREGGHWRIDLTRTGALADGLIRLFAGVAGQSDEDYVRHLVGRLKPVHGGT
ncbi:MAG: hypothetical protein WCF85_07005 [Rhodospirillaceae bacterium]